MPPAKARLMYELRKMKHEKRNLRSVFSLGGKVYVTYREREDKFEINNLSDITSTQPTEENDPAQQTEQHSSTQQIQENEQN